MTNLKKIRQLLAVRPDLRLSSDFIVGFPGETDEDFEDTMNLIAEVGFDASVQLHLQQTVRVHTSIGHAR